MLIDAIFALLVFFAFIKGMRQGLILSVFSLLAFLVGLTAALKLSAVVAVRLGEATSVSKQWLPFISFLLVFVLVVYLVNLGGRLIQQTAETIMLGWLNKLAGIVFYLLIYSMIYSIFLFYAVQMKLLPATTTSASVIYPYISPFAPDIIGFLGNLIPLFKDIFGQLEGFFEGVSNKIGH
jgi:membrane protein required for colicin V production